MRISIPIAFLPVAQGLNFGEPHQCSRLSTSSYVSFPGSPLFQSQQSGPGGYWSANEAEIVSGCRLAPRNVQEVSTAVKLLVHANCRFAVRGGGHMFWAGAANIQDGVTIDLSQMDRVVVSRDRKLTAVGAGARWQDVYSKLDPMNLSVVGGRVGSVVLANGQTVVASPQQHPDLYKALRGGGNNFGIVTRFTLRTFEQGRIWGGFILNPPNTTVENLQRLQEFNTASGNAVDRDATNNQVHLYDANGRSAVLNILVYTRPIKNPEILRPFSNLEPQMSNSMRITSLSEMTPQAVHGKSSERQKGDEERTARRLTYDSNAWASFSFANNATIIAHVLDLADEAFGPIKAIPGFSAFFSFQPISREIIQHMRSKGGNVLGIDPNRNIFWLNYGVSYSNAADDELVYSTTRSYFAKVEQYTRSMGQHERFIYMNYALPTQKVIESYGNVNGYFLRTVSRKYDPKQVFQKLVPGGFKLSPARPSEHGGPDSI
ncbi:MAG: hypothetical protein Q9226_000374 [Calogaya cf. arnoldii]